MSNRFENVGKVLKVEEDGKVTIQVKQPKTCSHCSESCAFAGKDNERVFEIYTDLLLKDGDNINVTIDDSKLKKSAFIAYLLPILIVVIVSLIMQKMGLEDIYIAITSLFTIAIYFLVIKLILKNKKLDIIVKKME
ncbi:MAG: SoxR reducing system RseC family protein [Calditerrivibrio sp.]|nr:SoxR reducing system RseC family protein [Calditerrivibrio sp.]